MKLTDVEAKAFWPVYNAYQNDLHKITKQLSMAIGVYAQAYSKGALSKRLNYRAYTAGFSYTPPAARSSQMPARKDC